MWIDVERNQIQCGETDKNPRQLTIGHRLGIQFEFTLADGQLAYRWLCEC